MKIKIRDLCSLKTFENINLIAGKDGLDRIVKGVGLLDYELDKDFKDVYFYKNLYPGLLCLTTFLYAKEQDFLILEAIKKLNLRGCSGLIIKNVYNFPLTNTILRYADSLGFPILLINSDTIVFEDIIMEVNQFSKIQESQTESTKIIDNILHKSLDSEKLIELSLNLNPSLRNHFQACYFYTDEEKYHYLLKDLPETSTVNYYKNGLMTLHSSDTPNLDINDINLLSGNEKYIGISTIHHDISEVKFAFEEAIQASMYCQIMQKNKSFYKDLGIFKLILFNCNNKIFLEYSREVLESLIEYDIKYNSELVKTLYAFIVNETNMHTAAYHLDVHENTVKYRLNKITEISNYDYKNHNDLEELSIAIKIYMCNRLCDFI